MFNLESHIRLASKREEIVTAMLMHRRKELDKIFSLQIAQV